MLSSNENSWNCKCKCVSQQTHKARWAFISKYKHDQYIKRLGLDISENESNSGLIKKLMIKKTNNNLMTEQIIMVNEVVYDKEKKQIIVQTKENNKPKSAKSAKSKSHKQKNLKKKDSHILIEKNLLELRDLIN